MTVTTDIEQESTRTLSVPVSTIIILVVLPSVVLPIAIITSILLYKHSQKRKYAIRLVTCCSELQLLGMRVDLSMLAKSDELIAMTLLTALTRLA